jgi:hypothetical protein
VREQNFGLSIMLEENAKNKKYRLYDEHLVRNIMLTTALSVWEYVRENPGADSDEICDFVDANAADIVSDTVKHLKGLDDSDEKGLTDDSEEDGADWSPDVRD